MGCVFWTRLPMSNYNPTHTPTVHQRYGQKKRQTDRRTDGRLTSYNRLVGASAWSPAYSWAPSYAAENQRAGKTRRRSIDSAAGAARTLGGQTRGHTDWRHRAKVTVLSCKLGNTALCSLHYVHLEVKIGQRLTKLSQKDCMGVFFHSRCTALSKKVWGCSSSVVTIYTNFDHKMCHKFTTDRRMAYHTLGSNLYRGLQPSIPLAVVFTFFLLLINTLIWFDLIWWVDLSWLSLLYFQCETVKFSLLNKCLLTK